MKKAFFAAFLVGFSVLLTAQKSDWTLRVSAGGEKIWLNESLRIKGLQSRRIGIGAAFQVLKFLEITADLRHQKAVFSSAYSFLHDQNSIICWDVPIKVTTEIQFWEAPLGLAFAFRDQKLSPVFSISGIFSGVISGKERIDLLGEGIGSIEKKLRLNASGCEIGVGLRRKIGERFEIESQAVYRKKITRNLPFNSNELGLIASFGYRF